MNKLNCRFGLMQPVDAGLDWIEKGASTVAEEFATASADAVQLRVSTAAVAEPATKSRVPVGSFDLHQSLRDLIGPASDPVSTVGVLFADRYAYGNDIFGIMFDTAFDLDVPSEGHASVLAGPPREGCAVFLGAIANHRGGGAEYADQALFTTIHEVGHLFNLQHEFVARCFMRESDAERTYDASYWGFLDGEKTLLARAQQDPHVWPGKSPFGDSGNTDAGGKRGARKSPLMLRIGLTRDHFYYYDPIELDITVKLGRRARALTIPDVVDPGYSQFRLWIEDPAGERRLFRSPRHYCGSGATRELRPGDAFHRDISFFGESGGYTFRRTGIHTVWAELDDPRWRTTVSNRLSFEVRRIKSYRASRDCEVLTRRGVRTVLYHRLDRHRGKGVADLEAWLTAGRPSESAGAVRYALARTMLEKATRAHAASHRKLEKFASEHLRRAIDARGLGAQQRRIAQKLVG